jgi:hypothetical protein
MTFPKRPRDPNQWAKRMVDIVSGDVDPTPDQDKDPEAVKRGRLGGQKGGKARAAKMTPEARSEAARNAVKARWSR